MPKNSSKSNWYVITGGPSSGKTTVLKELGRMGYVIYPEAARVLIDKEIAEGKTLKEIREMKNEAEFQKKVLKIKIATEKTAPKDKIVFFDRAIPDSIAYFQVCGLNPKEVLKFWQKGRYRKIFFLEQLFFKKDYARTENPQITEKLDKFLKESYQKIGYEVISVPAVSVEERVKIILAKL